MAWIEPVRDPRKLAGLEASWGDSAVVRMAAFAYTQQKSVIEEARIRRG